MADPAVPPQWRDDVPARTVEDLRLRRRRRSLLVVLFVLIAGGTGLAMLLTRLRPIPHPHFVPLIVSAYNSPQLPASTPAASDRAHFQADGFFAANLVTPDRAALRESLAALRQRPASERVVIYLSALAQAPPGAGVMILPVDAEPTLPETAMPLREVLDAVAACPARNKLLILDILGARTDPRLGLLANDLAAAVQAEVRAVPDPQRLVLCPCSPGEVSWASEDLRQTVFGYYFDAGLRGDADGANPGGQRDHQVTVRELAAFIRSHVERWTWRNLRARQTPVLLGEAADFPLVSFGAESPPPAPPSAEAEPYPDWLRDAWKARQIWWSEERYRLVPHLMRQMDAALLDTERTWRGGGDSAVLKQALASLLTRWENDYQRVVRLPQPEPLSLAQAVAQGRKPNEELYPSIRAELNRLPSSPIPDAKKDESGPAISAALLDKVRQSAPFDVAWNAWRLATEEEVPTAERVRILNALIAEREPQPQYAETLLLRRLADLAAQQSSRDRWPTAAVRLALEVAALGEKAMLKARALPWLRARLEDAAQARYEGELLLLTGRGYAPVGEAEAALKRATEHYQSCLLLSEGIDDASRTLDRALAFLPAYVAYLEAVPEQERVWQEAVATAKTLAERLMTPTPAAWDETTATAARLEKQLNQLRRPFAPEELAELKARCGRAGAQPGVLHDVNALLGLPYMTVEDRLSVWKAGRDLARRLNDVVLTLDREDASAYEDPAAADETRQRSVLNDEWRRTALRARCFTELIALGGMKPDGCRAAAVQFAAAIGAGDAPARRSLGELSAAFAAAWGRELPAALRDASNAAKRDRLARVLLPADPGAEPRETETLPAVALRNQLQGDLAAWRAERAIYEAKDLENQALLTPAMKRYFAKQQAGSRSTPSAAESFVEVDATPRPIRLTPTAPVRDVALQVRSNVAGAAAMTLRLFQPDGDWLRLSPDLTTQVKRLTTASETVPLRIGVNTTETERLTPPPLGVLIQARRESRAFHTRLPVSLRDITDRLDILLSSSPQVPETSPAAIELRPLGSPQNRYLFLHNPAPRTRKVIVELVSGGVVLPDGRAAITLTPNETKLVSFTAPTPPVLSPPTTPGATKPIELPELAGALEVRVFDVEERNQLIEAKTFPIEVVAPRSYVEIGEVRYIPPSPERKDGKSLLEVTLRPSPSFTGPPCLVELVLSPAQIPGLLGVRKGTFRGELTRGGDSLRLTAEDLQLAPGADENGQFSLTIDGVERAVVFRATFPRIGDPTTPRETVQPALRLRSSGYARPGDPRAVAIEADHAPAGSSLEVRLGRVADGSFVAEMSRALPTARRRHIGFTAAGPGGALLFEASIADWAVPLDTGRVVGTRYVQVRLLDRDRVPLRTVTQALTLDDAPAQNVRFLDTPRYARKGTTVTLKAAGTNRVAGIEKVLFFLGKPADGKLPADVEPVPGRPVDADRSAWTATLPLPRDRVGPTEFSVQFVTRTGVSEFKTGVVEIVDADPARLTPGRIAGIVVEGATPYPGIDVVLLDEKAMEKGRTKTNDQGRFTFDGVLPGTYQLRAEKTKNPRRVGKTSVTVVADQEATSTIKLYLP